MIKAVIFDMDGLMIDSERITFVAYQEEMKKIGLSFSAKFFTSLLGKPVTTATILFKEEYGQDFELSCVLGNVHEYLANYFKEYGVPIKKGLRELLSYLKTNNIKTIVATSSQRNRVDTILSSTGLTQYFDDSICGDEVTNGKPNPEIFLTACKKLGVLPSEAIVLEDSLAGIQASSNANIPVICIPDIVVPDEQHKAMCFHVLPTLDDVIPIIENEKQEAC